MSKELEEMISSALDEEARESDCRRREHEAPISEAKQEKNLFRLVNSFEHYAGKEACSELEPKYAVNGRDGSVEMEAEHHKFKLEVHDVENGEFLKKGHPLYALVPEGCEPKLLGKIAFNDELETKLLARIGSCLREAA